MISHLLKVAFKLLIIHVMNSYFGIPFEFNKEHVISTIEQRVADRSKGYICVVDGNIISEVQLNPVYASIINTSLLNICDSSWAPIFIRWIHKARYESFTGDDLFIDLLSERKYKSMFLGSTPEILENLKEKLKTIDPDINEMIFLPLPFCTIDEFDYKGIAESINEVDPDLIWISLGAPKQEEFMSRLFTFVNRGIIIAVGAVFNYHSGYSEKKRAPAIFIKLKIEWFFRMVQEPKKNISRVVRFLRTVPKILISEFQRKHGNKSSDIEIN